ncbi:uncharacterized protein EI97DRAFT_450220 [Westerdykella ornata]|uniref:Uncharacterized protein n=1 Tax=Westerdykella ornata TaxID=318751 RepID=A0A6A6JI96_WESOR|nr:uncharacterized protein EI97DRAFT_450220 [Westerdykella ornata]KAF2276370.1 hypothetical protein EI97DRAFT_450220 [Westerdykella ornata]
MPGSAGKIMPDKQQQKPSKANTAEGKTTISTAPRPRTADAQESNADTTTMNGASANPNRTRRRPRKLNKEPPSSLKLDQTRPPSQSQSQPQPPAASTPTALPPSTKASNPHTPTTSATGELEALESRVRGLEAKVEELYKAGRAARGVRSPRRRGKGSRRNYSKVQVGDVDTGTSAAAEQSGKVVGGFEKDAEHGRDDGTVHADMEREAEEEEEEAKNEELVRLEGELAVARRDLESYQRPRQSRRRRSTRLDEPPEGQGEEEDLVEEIPRVSSPGIQRRSQGGRQVTLIGSYRIPLPATVSMDDVRSIQSGVSAAQNVARSFLEQRRAAARTTGQTRSRPQQHRQQQQCSSAVPQHTTEADGKQSWAEWFGGYTMAISRAVRNIEAEAAIESSQSRIQSDGDAEGLSRKGAKVSPKKRTPAADSMAKLSTTKSGARSRQQRQSPSSKDPDIGGLNREAVQGLVS